MSLVCLSDELFLTIHSMNSLAANLKDISKSMVDELVPIIESMDRNPSC